MGLLSQDILAILASSAAGLLSRGVAPRAEGTAWFRRRAEQGPSKQERHGTLIVGVGSAACALGCILARTQPVWMVDSNQERTARARAAGLEAACGNALDAQVLQRVRAGQVRHFIALTPNAEVNTLAALLARAVFFVPEVHVLNSGDVAGHAALVDHLGVSTIFGGPVALEDWDYRIDHDQAERTGLPIQHAMAPASLYQALQTHQSSLPLAVRRGDQYLPFHSQTDLRKDDRVILFQDTTPSHDVRDRFDWLVSRCPVLDVERTLPMEAFFDAVAGALAPRLEMDSARLAAALMSRETAGSTVLLPGLAIPHVMIQGRSAFEVLIARCREGIPFPGQPEHVHAVFVLAGTPDERNFHLRALSAIAQIVQAPDFETKWLTASSAEALREIVLHSTRRRYPEVPRPTGRASSEQVPR